MDISVEQFYERGLDSCSLSIVSGQEFMGRTIKEMAMNRPGLALTGFFQHFPNMRVQVFGLAENAYLKNLSPAARKERLTQLFKQRIPCVVLTRNRHALPELLESAEKHKVPVLKSPLITNRFVNLATLVMENLAAPTLKYQGTMIDVRGIGVMLEGAPGIGKSETALALIERGYSLVADDLTVLRRESTGIIVGMAEDITRYHMEIRGIGLIHVPSLFGVSSMRIDMRLDLIVRLVEYNNQWDYDRTGLNSQTATILGAEIPAVTIPVAAGRDIAHVVEVAALNQKLKQLGHDAAKELDEKLMRALERKRRI